MMNKRPIILLNGKLVRPSGGVQINTIAPVTFPSPILSIKPQSYVSRYEIRLNEWDGSYRHYEARILNETIRPSGRMLLEFEDCQRRRGVNYG
jgi:hypothetical protein